MNWAAIAPKHHQDMHPDRCPPLLYPSRENLTQAIAPVTPQPSPTRPKPARKIRRVTYVISGNN
ncbi:MAG: hypothetical protein EA395_03945 [Phormidium sp. GEM2.Bin31]|nr:MAG: hypothetical protein EA395_03945 [Phormidium sp. GEM2.Bin31]